MSYIPDNQRLGPPLDELLPCIDRLREAMLERLRNRDTWQDEHIEKLERLLLDMQALEFRLIALKQETR